MSRERPLIFCPECETLLLTDPACPNCRWQRPAPADRPGQRMGPPLQLAGHLPGYQAGLIAVPATAGDLLVIGLQELTPERSGVLLALDAATQRERWRHRLPPGKLCCFPVVSGDRVLVASEDVQMLSTSPAELCALDRATGRLIWSYPPQPRSNAAAIHSFSAPAVAPPDAAGRSVVFAVDNSGRGVGLDYASGALLWEVDGLRWSAEPPAATPDGFLVQSADRKLIAVDRAGRRTALTAPLPPDSPQPRSSAVGGATLYLTVGRSYRELWAVELPSGRVRWQNADARGVTTPPLVGPLIYIGVKETGETKAGGKRSYAIWAIDPATGRRRARFGSDHHVYAPLACDAEQLYAAVEGEGLVALDPLTLAERWRAPLPEASGLRAAPLLAGHRVAVLDHRGALFTVAARSAPPEPTATAAVYAARGDWEQVVAAAALEGDLRAAGAAAARLQRWFQAGQLYERADAWREAGAAYLRAPRYRHAARCFERAGLGAEAAEALAQGGHLVQAAERFVAAGLPQRAADTYLQAGRREDAAAQFALAGAVEQAVALYRELQQLAPAAALLEAAGQIDRAVALWREHGQTAAAVEVLARRGRPLDAARLLEAAQQIDAAVALLDRCGLRAETAALWQRNRRWDLAAQRLDELGDRAGAAELYEKAGQIERAAQLYRALGEPQRAITLYENLQLAGALAETYAQINEWGKAAAYHLQTEPPNHAAAADCFERAEMWTEAARSYEVAAAWEAAVRCWKVSATPRRAAELLAERLRRPEAAAELLRAQGDLPAAADLLRQHGRFEAAAELYIASGQAGRAWELLRAAGAWELLRRLATAHEADRPLAEACAQLLQTTPGRAARARLHHTAAAALARAAHREEAAGLNADDVAACWEAAAGHFAEAGDPSDAAACRLELIRLRRLPDLHLTVSAPSELVEEQWNKLVVSAVNRGYGDAWYLSVRVDSAEFEGNLNRSQALGHLIPNDAAQLLVSVRPLPERAGAAVPLQLQLSYVLDDDSEVTREIRADVRVIGKAEHDAAVRGRRDGQPPSQVIHIYTDKEVKTYAGSDYSQTGDRVEVNRGDRRFGVQGSAAPVCPHCGAATPEALPYCQACGRALRAAAAAE